VCPRRERRDGRGERRASALPKNWKECMHQVMSEQEEREVVKRGATGGQVENTDELRTSRAKQDEAEAMCYTKSD
jgi:hypothetical protein